MSHKSNRTNAEWTAELRGEFGPETQIKAHHDLAAYLYVVLLNQLENRRPTMPKMIDLDQQEFKSLAEDFLQMFMLKMTQNNYLLLDKFSGTGRFLAWTAQVALNLTMSELRKVEWRNQRLSSEQSYIDVITATPEAEAVRMDIAEAIEKSLSALPVRYQVALRRCIMDGDCAKEVAVDLSLTQNAVHILVYRAKKALLRQLRKHDIGPDSLAVYAL